MVLQKNTIINREEFILDEKLQIKKAIVHILNQKVSLVLSNATLELDEDILKLISDYIKNAYENQGRVFAKFKTEGSCRKFAIDILKMMLILLKLQNLLHVSYMVQWLKRMLHLLIF